MIWGPTFEEMREPALLPAALRGRLRQVLVERPLDPINLFNITWKDFDGNVRHVVIPPQLSGVSATILVLIGRHFPSGSHKVGAVYSILLEKQLSREVAPAAHTLVLPSTGNYGIGGAWVGPRMGYRSLVVLPEEMSAERFEKIRGYGADVIATPGCESNVKEIFDKVKELRRISDHRILEQFSEFGNYRFHYHVTGHSILDLVRERARAGQGDGRVAAFVSAMGSAGTIAAGDLLKEQSETCIVGLEPVQCPTLYNVGYGGHRIEGIGDKHVTWIHNVLNMDYLLCIDEMDCLQGLQLLEEGHAHLARELGIDAGRLECLSGCFGVSGICNLLGAIQTAKLLGLGSRDTVVTIATDGFDRYPSVLRKLDAELGPMRAEGALRRIEIFQRARPVQYLEGSRSVRRRWHNQKYFTWVEQQGRSLEELEAQLDPAFWQAQRERIAELDRQLMDRRGPPPDAEY
jgi:cysteine synthase